MSFTQYLIETANEEKLTHLEHAEDHPVNAGSEGFEHARRTLNAVSDALQGKKSAASVTTKFDGSPSIVFGHNPENGKFFVASKSAFNKNPKLNYTSDDIEKNHGHAPGLVSKLKLALEHLPKVAPGEGVFQGDIMHSGAKSKENPEGDVEVKGKAAHFKPNTITYSTKTPEETDQAAQAKIGVAVHTAYHGPSFSEMKATYNAGHDLFGEHPDVHLLDVHHEMDKSDYTAEHQDNFKHHMDEAGKLHGKMNETAAYDTVAPHTEHIKTYINKTVREGSYPNSEDYKSHVADTFQKRADKVKTDTAKQSKIEEGQKLIDSVESHKDHFDTLWDMHHHLQSAKNELVHALASHQTYGHKIKGQEAKPEGYVAVINNRPTKLVDREEFSRANFEQNRGE